MEKIVILLTLALCGCNALYIDDLITNRITNAEVAPIENFNYSISLQRLSELDQPTRGHVCGGVLITLQHALTAATCSFQVINGVLFQIDVSQHRVFAGATMLTNDTDTNRIRPIANITIHPGYIHPPSSLNNIAIITLTTPYLNTIGTPLALPAANFDPADFTVCQIASWGAESIHENASVSLRATNKFIYSHNLCRSVYSQRPFTVNVFPSMICAATLDVVSSGCYGDEGVPLVCNGVLTGILFETNQCAFAASPEVYTRVSNYTEWIRSISGSPGLRPEISFLGVVAIVIAMFVSKV
ncbi:unnamed protein product [Arctia plantaginis]|uniref:Peptidase S1 domain-containing protein n=1 Tax=Arctia plantaginis TaxID=874455 RepID=A0A8S0ZTW0_ARCPL|nr:unnamed protein product [Arctia plantaginis]